MTSIDVAVPCYQYGRYLRDCVSSILSQDVENLRVLIVDNGSTDGSVDVARRLAAEDDRVHVVRFETNRGPQAAYNYGIDWASADYFLLIDADDVLAPGALPRAIDVLTRNNNVVFAHGGEWLHMFNAGRIPPLPNVAGSWKIQSGRSFLEHSFRSGSWTVGPNTVVRRTWAQKKAGYYSPELPDTDDIDLWLRLALLGDVAETTAVQTVRRVHSDQRSVRLRDDSLYEIDQINKAYNSFFRSAGAELFNANSLRRIADRGLARSSLWTAVGYFREGRNEAGIQCMRYAVAASLTATLPRIFRRFWLFLWPPSRLASLLSAVWAALHSKLSAARETPNISPGVALLGEDKK